MQAHTSYFLCSTARTGSWLLAEALQGTNLAGRVREYFAPGNQKSWSEQWGIENTANYSAFLEKAIEAGTTSNGVFGAKLLGYQLESFLSKLRQLPECKGKETLEIMPSVFPNIHYIWLSRRDKVRQAVSLWKAKQTEIWREYKDQHVAKDQHAPRQKPVFDFEAIDRWRNTILKHEAGWRRYFRTASVEPLMVSYEELGADYQATVLKVLQHLSIPLPADFIIPPPRLKKQADLLSEKWVWRYRKLKGDQLLDKYHRMD
jgi:LPS sulfotransferase NodH